MKYLRLYESFEDNASRIHEICKQYRIYNYTINNDGSIDVDGHVSLGSQYLEKIPIKFNVVKSFNCFANKLTSLEGSPVEVNGNFNCYENKLTSLQYAPKIIIGSFDCDDNNIKSFEYFPNYVSGIFRCYFNPIQEIWWLFEDTKKIELLNDFDIFRDEDTNEPVIIMDRLNDFLLTIGKKSVEKVYQYKNI